VVGKTAATIIEISNTSLDPGYKLFIGLNTGRFDIRNEGFLADLNRLIGTEGRKHLGGEIAESGVVFKAIDGIVGGANDLHVRAADKLLCAILILLKTSIYSVPDILCGFFGENLVYIEVSLQLKMSPMVYGVSDKIRHNTSESNELLILVSVTGYKFLGNAACTHLTPLVMVSSKEEVIGIAEAIILGNLLRA
jgi:hypothetical protein